MGPVEAYKILKEHKANQDRLIGEKTVGLIIANSVLFVAFFMSMSKGNFTVLHCVLPAIGFILCSAAAASLAGDTKARWRSIESLRKIEKDPDFLSLKSIQGRPITDIEDVARWYVKHPGLQIADFFWPIFPVFFIVAWVFLLIGI